METHASEKMLLADLLQLPLRRSQKAGWVISRQGITLETQEMCGCVTLQEPLPT